MIYLIMAAFLFYCLKRLSLVSETELPQDSCASEPPEETCVIRQRRLSAIRAWLKLQKRLSSWAFENPEGDLLGLIFLGDPKRYLVQLSFADSPVSRVVSAKALNGEKHLICESNVPDFSYEENLEVQLMNSKTPEKIRFLQDLGAKALSSGGSATFSLCDYEDASPAELEYLYPESAIRSFMAMLKDSEGYERVERLSDYSFRVFLKTEP